MNIKKEKWSNLIGNNNAVGNPGNPNSKGRPKVLEDEKHNQRIVIMVTKKEKQYFSEKINKTRIKPRQVILDFLNEN